MEDRFEAQRQWFADWLLADEMPMPLWYERNVAILHPGTEPTGDTRLPFAAPNANDDDLSPAQAAVLDRILLGHAGPETRCTAALYGGFQRPRQQEELVKAGLTLVEGRLPYFLVSGTLKELGIAATEARFGGFLPLSFLWPNDRSWFVSSQPDAAFTVVGGDAAFAAALLGEPVLNAHEWPSTSA